MKLDPYSPVPLHAQLTEYIKSEILKGNYTGKIPSEREFMEEFNVSRTTVRESISTLVRDDFLEKRHGRGTFVNLRPVHEMWHGNLKSYTENIEAAGMKPGAKLLFSGIRSKPETIARKFNSESFYFIERLRYANDNIMAIERKFFDLEIGIKLAEFDLDQANIYEILENSLGVTLCEAEETITSQVPSLEDAKLLGISKSSSVLVTERSTYSPEKKLIEVVNTVFRADKYAVTIKMKRNNSRSKTISVEG
ncbi:transcriptional regulator [Desulfitobacterium dehalogenans ATCC 51507]|uniref:Transcriptional regulator n=1 Tax=Desulfitobacterium dehalogenans (strain ATCC 51507 / DSM 9161 / JW/IU-DC1) TaxID=756499 RepID=I4AE54_DESDJ|nr:GntR family transcriptional regulator [Desulfitobacterium dehalogenans]AFM02239.1 transcriptional regulator [Desulfitobacterium dehalogenans ATCC 51507]